jgi:hypothetical protein
LPISPAFGSRHDRYFSAWGRASFQGKIAPETKQKGEEKKS